MTPTNAQGCLEGKQGAHVIIYHSVDPSLWLRCVERCCLIPASHFCWSLSLFFPMRLRHQTLIKIINITEIKHSWFLSTSLSSSVTDKTLWLQLITGFLPCCTPISLAQRSSHTQGLSFKTMIDFSFKLSSAIVSETQLRNRITWAFHKYVIHTKAQSQAGI